MPGGRRQISTIASKVGGGDDLPVGLFGEVDRDRFVLGAARGA